MHASDVIQLIKKYHEFCNHHNSADLREFGTWLTQKSNGKKRTADDTKQIDRDLGYLLNRLARFSRYHIKHAFAALPIQSLEEFTVLSVLGALGDASKNEVYKHAVLEVATGQQMMNRLLRSKLVLERTLSEDQRVRMVQLTQKGKKTLSEAFEILGEVSSKKFSTLSKDERILLRKVLEKVNVFETEGFQ